MDAGPPDPTVDGEDGTDGQAVSQSVDLTMSDEAKTAGAPRSSLIVHYLLPTVPNLRLVNSNRQNWSKAVFVPHHLSYYPPARPWLFSSSASSFAHRDPDPKASGAHTICWASGMAWAAWRAGGRAE